MSDDIEEAVQNLRFVTACRCDAAWTDRQLHAPGCWSDYQEDVAVVASALGVDE